MALRERKKVKEYSIDEMMRIINCNFINTNHEHPIPNYVISSTTWLEAQKSFIVCDSREEELKIEDGDPERLANYYGETIKEAVTKCFDDRINHSIYSIEIK